MEWEDIIAYQLKEIRLTDKREISLTYFSFIR